MADIYNQYKNFKAFEVIFTTDNGTEKKLSCAIRTVDNGTIIIDADNEQNNNVTLDIGSELKLYIYTESGVYTATSSVLEVGKNGSNTAYTIERPYDTKHSQRREYFRTDMKVDFELNTSFQNENSDELELIKADKPVNFEVSVSSPQELCEFSGKTRNICGKGMSFVADKPINLNDNMEINITIKFKNKDIETKAKLVYSKEYETTHYGKKYIHAFYFNEISQGDIDFIIKKCFMHQLELRRQNKI